MLDERAERRLRIAVLECVDDLLMLDDHLRQHRRRAARAEPGDTDEAAQLAEQAVEDRELRALGDLEVELLVEIEEVVLAAVLGGAPHSAKQDVELVDVLEFHHLTGPPHRHALERLAQHQDLGLVLRREPPDDDLPA